MQNVDEQQLELFREEGGLLTGDVEKDPVSGNDVPPGSRPEEVRDDIPAMLSENEYVVPADVVRYYGVKFFEDLRAQAKEGLMGMERNGRIGGQPVDSTPGDEPLSPEEEMMLREMMGMAQGGMVPQQNEVMSQMSTQGYNPMERQEMLYSVPKPAGNMRGFQEGGMSQTPDYTEMFKAYMQPGGIFQYQQQQQQNIIYTPYVNDQGSIIVIPMVDTDGDGKGDRVQEGTNVPEGYRPQSEVTPTVTTPTQEREGRGERDTSPEPNTDPSAWEDPDNFRNALNQKDFTNALIGGVSLVAPTVGVAIGMGYSRTLANAAQELKDRIANPETPPNLRTEFESILKDYEDSGVTPAGTEKKGPLEGFFGDVLGGVKTALGNIFGSKEKTATPTRGTTEPRGTTPSAGRDRGDRDDGRFEGPSTPGTSLGATAETAREAETFRSDTDLGFGSGVGSADIGGFEGSGGLGFGSATSEEDRFSDLGNAPDLNKGGLIAKPKRTPKKSTPRGKRGLGKG